MSKQASLQELEARADELRTELAETEAQVQLSYDQEASAREAAIRQGVGPYSDVNSPAMKVIRARERNEKRCITLRKELETLAVVLAEERERVGREALAARFSEIDELRAKETGVLTEAAGHLLTLMQLFYTRYLAVVEELDQLDRETRNGDLAGYVGESWDVACRPVVSPVAADFMAFMEALYEAAIRDPNRRYRIPDELLEIVPDGSGLLRYPQLSGRVATRKSVEPEAVQSFAGNGWSRSSSLSAYAGA